MGKADPDLLYHYTSEAGLRGIVENDNIWATDIHFLNDWTEFSHVFNNESLQTFLDAFISSLPPDIDPEARGVTIDRVLSKRNFPQFLAIIESRPPLGKPKEAFVCSFTADAVAGGNPGDRLSQWRGYSHGSQGFSLGFDRTLLKQQVETQDNHDDATAQLVDCIYDDERKRSVLADMGCSAATAFRDLRASAAQVPSWFTIARPNPTDAYKKDSYYLVKSLTTVTPVYYKMAAQFKHKGFAEEHEWRIVFHTFHESLLPRLKSRNGPFGLTPFVELPLGLRNPETCSLRRIVVGPSTHVGPSTQQDAVKNAVELLLQKHGIACVEVAISTIPYRSE